MCVEHQSHIQLASVYTCSFAHCEICVYLNMVVLTQGWLLISDCVFVCQFQYGYECACVCVCVSLARVCMCDVESFSGFIKVKVKNKLGDDWTCCGGGVV